MQPCRKDTGNYGGSWNPGSLPGWPHGRGDAQYDFWSPIVVDYGDTLFGNAAPNNNLDEQRRRGDLARHHQVEEVQEPEWPTRRHLHRRRDVPHLHRHHASEGAHPRRALGRVIAPDRPGVRRRHQRGRHRRHLGVRHHARLRLRLQLRPDEVRSQQAQVFVPEGPDQDIATKSWRFTVDFFGNTVWNPNFFVAFKKLTDPRR